MYGGHKLIGVHNPSHLGHVLQLLALKLWEGGDDVLVDGLSEVGHVLQLLALKLWEGGDDVLVDGLSEVEDLVALLQQTLNKRKLLNLLLAVA